MASFMFLKAFRQSKETPSQRANKTEDAASTTSVYNNKKRSQSKAALSKSTKSHKTMSGFMTARLRRRKKKSATIVDDQGVTHEEQETKAPHQGCTRHQPTLPKMDIRSPPAESTTASTDHISEVKRLLEEGTLNLDKPDIKLAAKELALQASKIMPKGYLEEYATAIKKYVPPGMTKRHYDKNSNKNRYKDVFCGDNERVVLKERTGGCSCGDYIHANHVKGQPLMPKQHFILTQGPTTTTLSDFWRMIKQENCQQIIMLCETVELGKPKCIQYWPLYDNDVMQLVDADLSMVNKGRYVHCPGVVTTVLEVTDMKTKQVNTLFHHQWKTWPDRGVPDNAEIPLRLLQMARACAEGTSVVVHCSAGIGRTGTVVVIEMAIQALLQGKCPDPLALVKQLRTMRCQSVQTDMQYVFVVKALLTLVEKINIDAEGTRALEDFQDAFMDMYRAEKAKKPKEEEKRKTQQTQD